MARTSVQIEPEFEFTLKCKGLSEADLHKIYHALAKEFPEHRPAFRNPFTPQFTAKDVHEILVFVTGSTAAGYIAKKVFDKTLDIISDVVKKKLEKAPEVEHKQVVSILGPDGKVATRVEKDPEPKVKKRKG